MENDSCQWEELHRHADGTAEAENFCNLIHKMHINWENVSD